QRIAQDAGRRGRDPDEHPRNQERERDAGVRRRQQAVRPLEVRDGGSRAPELALGPVSQPNPADRPNGDSAGGEPRADDQGDRERNGEHDQGSSGAPTASNRSKYTRSMRRRRTRSATIRKPARTVDSPDFGTRPKSANTSPPTVVTSSTPKSVSRRSLSSAT